MVSPCKICGNEGWSIHYQGPIRVGAFGSSSTDPHTVWRCGDCGAAWLEGATVEYESDAYRTLVDGDGGIETYHRKHDGDQARLLRLLGTTDLRDRVIVDVGCGGGSLLDFFRGVASATIGIEPNLHFRAELERKGHVAHAYCALAAVDWTARVDLACCFSVIEHVDDPVALLREMRGLIRPGGRALISTPNREDWMLDLLPDAYGPFFYRQVHRWYWDAASLKRTCERAGFASVRPFHVHRFDLANFMVWLRDRRPSGHGHLSVPVVLDACFASAMEEAGRADYLFAWLDA